MSQLGEQDCELDRGRLPLVHRTGITRMISANHVVARWAVDSFELQGLPDMEWEQ